MEILKRVFASLLCILSTATFAQNNLHNAFVESYTLEANKNYEGAIASIKDACNESCYECYYRIGWLYFSEAKYNDAAANYSKAALIMPASIEPLLGLAAVYYKTEKWIELENTYLTILKIDSKNSKANYRLGLIYYYKKDYVKALQYFQVSLNLYPTDIDSLIMTAWVNYYLGNISAAKILFNKAILLQPSNESAKDGLRLVN